MRATSPQIAHEARLQTQQVTRQTRNAVGNYEAAEFQWGVVDSISAGPPPSVDLYLDGTQTLSNTAYLTKGVRYLAGYVPTVGDTVIVQRGLKRSASDRVVIGKLDGSTSPYPLPLGGVNSSSQFVQGPNAIWGGAGVPPSTLGIQGDYYFRTDTPATADQRLYVYQSTGWVGIL